MRQERAKRIMRLMGWGQSETARQFNRVAGTRLGRQNVNAQINGTRGVSDSLAVFLRMAVRVAVLERRQGRSCYSEQLAMALQIEDAKNEPEKVIAEFLLMLTNVPGAPTPRDGRIYRSHAHILFQYGRFWSPAPRPKSVRKREIGRCFRNSASVLREHQKLCYCEGYSVLESLTPIHHGWLVDENGNVIDPTWNQALAYFGVVIDRDYVLACRKRKKGMNDGILVDWIHGSPILSMDSKIWLPKNGPYVQDK